MTTAKARKKDQAVRVGRERAKVWVITVINPILEGMASERYWLSLKNWSWRHRTGWFERLRYIPAYLDMRYFANYEDFCTEYKEISDSFRAHDDALSRMAEVLNVAYGRLLELYKFRQEFEWTRKESLRKGIDYERAWRGFSQDECLKLVAEYVLNNLSSIPDHYTTADYWKEFGPRFLELRSHQVVKELLGRVHKQGDKIIKATHQIEKKLKALRSDYAQKFDIPPVPLEA